MEVVCACKRTVGSNPTVTAMVLSRDTAYGWAAAQDLFVGFPRPPWRRVRYLCLTTRPNTSERGAIRASERRPGVAASIS